jgi:CelD/BcsL family acetyltransferase involved in cellulose biosynthesis
VLSLEGEPVAFWPGWVYNRSFYSSTPGYDPALAEYRLGQYVLMRLIRDLCDDPDADLLDFGFGDSEYKRRFSTEEWREADVLVFAPSFKGARVNAGRTAVGLGERALRRAVERAGLEERIKRAWRRRLAA